MATIRSTRPRRSGPPFLAGTWPFEPHRKPEAISRCWTCVAFRRG